MNAIRNWRMVIAYDGTPYFGWQRQKTGVAVQQLVEQSLSTVFGVPLLIQGASRTDAGVHAMGQVAHFFQPAESRDFPVPELLRAVNAHLPPQVRVLALHKARPDFHAQYGAKGKHYRYRIFNGPILPPLEFQRAWQVPLPLEVDGMQKGADFLMGTHDFASFAAASKTVRETTIRTLTRLKVVRKGPLISLEVEGNSFLYRMVRSIAGALVHVGLGKEPPEWVGERLKIKRRQPGIVTAPPHGLYLMKVFY